MRSIALIVSAEIDFRGKVKSILAGFDSDLEFRLASDEKIGLGRLQEEDHQIVIVDDDSVKNFFEEKCSSLKVSSKSCFIKVRTGGRRSVRLRQSPFAYTEVIIENASKLDELKTDILQAVAAAAGHKGRRSEAALKDAKAPQAPQSEKVRQVDSSQGRMASESTLALPPEFSEPVRKVNPEMFLPEIIVIGSSTGGPEALERFFTSVDYNFIVPVVVVQHMPAGFTKGLADRITRMSGFTACEVTHNQEIKSGVIHIAPGDFHLKLKKAGDKVISGLDQTPLINSVRPAVDPMFETASRIYGQKVMGLVLTGMGEDGAVGARFVKAAGGCILIQNEASCIVFGMPGSVFRLGIQDGEGTPERLAAIIGRQMCLKGATPIKRVKVS